MTALEKPQSLTVEEYLEGEQHSEVRHEYIGGVVYAMAGGSTDHNTIALNIASALRNHVAGKGCRVFMADVKVRLEIAQDDVFYYPDVMVGCDPRDTDKYFLRYPKVLVEVMSESTERTDRREKLLSYMRIESLEAYVLVAQDRREVTILQRGADWKPQVLREHDAVIQIDCLQFTLPLRSLYDGVGF